MACCRCRIAKGTDYRRHDAPFLRVLADYLSATHTQPQMLAEALELLKPGPLMRPEDHLWLARAWIGAGSVAKARAAWEEIPPPLSQGIEAARLNVDLLRREGRLRESAQAEAALAHYGEDLPSLAVRQCVMEINQSAFPEVRLRAHERLWELARRQDAAGLDAIRMLSRQEGRTEKEAGELLALVEQHPTANTAHRLDLISLLMRLAPARRAELIQAEVSRCAKDSQTELKLLVGWLAQEGQTEWLLELRSQIKLKPQEWFSLEARALAAAKRWQPLLHLIEQQEHEPVSQADVAHWRAVALMQLHPKETAAPRTQLQQAIRQGNAEKNLAVVATAARIAEDWQMPDLALEAYQVLAQPGSPQEAAMLESAMRIATSLKDTATLADLAARLAQLQPDNRLTTRRAAYLNLLRGENLELTTGKTFALPDHDTAGWLLAAFNAWRLGDVRATRDGLHHITETLDLTPGERAVFAGLLAKTGATARAYQIAEKVRPELLLPEERAFLNPAL